MPELGEVSREMEVVLTYNTMSLFTNITNVNSQTTRSKTIVPLALRTRECQIRESQKENQKERAREIEPEGCLLQICETAPLFVSNCCKVEFQTQPK